MKNWLNIEKSIFSNIKMIFDISKKEFKKEFAGTKLGILWAIIRPLSMILVFWFVFSRGLRPGKNLGEEIPYILWIISGYIPWIFISDTIVNGASSIRTNSFLVKKVKFPVEILPMIRIVINLYTFFILLGISLLIFLVYGYLLRINFIKLIYCVIASIVFLSALSRLLSTWVVMSIDVLHGISVLIQFLFWMTPIMWDSNSYSKLVITILKVNPFYYLVDSFREAFLGFGSSLGDFRYGAYFWLLTIILFIVSSNVYTRLRPEFDDVL